MSVVPMVFYEDYYETIEGEDKIPHYVYPDVWTSFAKDALMNVFLYTAIVLVAVLLVVGLFVSRKKPQIVKSYVRTAIAVACGFAVAVIASMLALEFYDMYENGYVFDLVLWPSVACVAAVVLGIAAVYICSLFSKKAFKTAAIVCGSIAAAAFVALFVCLAVYFASGDAAANNGVEVTLSESVVLYCCAAALIAAVVVLAFLFDRGNKRGFDSKSIAYAAVCIAMSFALSYIAPIHMPQGGSVTIASLLPLMIYSYMFGTKKGVLAGAVYGLLQIIQDPWIIHPAQLLLDYPIAFAGIGLTGMFAHTKKLEKYPQVQLALGAIVGSVFRFAAHLLSGVFAFSEYAPDTNAWLYSLGYNASYVFADIAIAIAAGVIVFSSPAFVRQVRKFSAVKKPAAETVQPAAEIAQPAAEIAQPAAEIAQPAAETVQSVSPAPADNAPIAQPADNAPAEKTDKQ